MQKKPSWFWTIFLLLYVFACVSGGFYFLQPSSPPRLYYTILISFDSVFLVGYLLNIVAVLFDILAIIPFYCFLKPTHAVHIERFFSRKTWQWFFLFRIILIFVGHNFDVKQIQALFHTDIRIALSVINIILILHLPSYITTFLYAFRQPTLPQTSS
ncbi:MAG: hypothetical protein H6754_01905 [Candidatus Omnitrophica bacterium]|nr:hypothetical protein [Candidatus Omnitrophota bacterium]